MKCPRCQHEENPFHAKFCLGCGARLAAVCIKCQTELPASAKFCLECGEPVAARASASRFANRSSRGVRHVPWKGHRQ